MDKGRIVLDSFDHAIRDFPGVLPSALSSEIAGHDIMHYFRQNEHMQLYDLIGKLLDSLLSIDTSALILNLKRVSQTDTMSVIRKEWSPGTKGPRVMAQWE